MVSFPISDATFIGNYKIFSAKRKTVAVQKSSVNPDTIITVGVFEASISKAVFIWRLKYYILARV